MFSFAPITTTYWPLTLRKQRNQIDAPMAPSQLVDSNSLEGITMGKRCSNWMFACVLTASISACGGGGGGGSTGSGNAGAPTNCQAGLNSTCESVTVLGQTRTYVLHAPANHTKTHALVLLLHGYGSDGAIYESVSQFSQKADEAGFVVVYPDAMVEQVPPSLWTNTQYGTGNIQVVNSGLRNWSYYGNVFNDNDIPFF